MEFCKVNRISKRRHTYENGKGTILCAAVCRCTGKYDIVGQLVFQNDVIENHDGLLMIIRYGTYDAFCPVDSKIMDSVGFYAEAAGYPAMPIGNLNEYARVVGNIVDTPNIISLNEK